MDELIRIVQLQRPEKGCSTAAFSPAIAEQVQRFHRSFREYAPTPLRNLKNLAMELGVSGIYVKDESYRFGLNAFKVLGGSYCLGRVIAQRTGISPEEMSCELLRSPAVREKAGSMTFITATDGNHGRGIAWSATKLGYKSIVYMPKGSAPERLENIRKAGADASITELCYDDTVRMAAKEASEKGYTLVQDTAWEGYTEIPLYIMQGYTTLGVEIKAQLEDMGEKMPTHVFLQAGVGSMAGAIAAWFAEQCRSADEMPHIIVVEPLSADCHYRTADANDGILHGVEGEMRTIMAGLACGEPCLLSWEILHDYADYFAAIPDYVAANGMRILAAPMGDDAKITSGESGASGFGLAVELLRNPDMAKQKQLLGLDENSRILCLSTEGATDRDNYRRIVWDGAFSK